MKIKHIKRPKIRIRRPRIRIRWRKKTSRWVIGAAVLFFLSLFALQLVLMSYTKTILQNVLSMQIQQATDGMYKARFEDIDISYTQKNLIIHQLHLMPQNEEEEDSPGKFIGRPNRYDILIPQVNINGINLRKAYLQELLEIQSIVLVEPLIKLQLDFDAEDQAANRILTGNLSRLLPSSIKALTIGTVRIQNGELALNALKDDQYSEIHASPLFLELRNFQLNPDTAQNPDKIFYTDNFYVAIDSLSGKLADNAYSLSLEALKASSADSSAFAQRVSLTPLKPIEELVHHTSLRNAYAMEFQQLYIYGLSFQELYNTRDFIADEITVLNPTLKLYNLQPLSPGQKESFRIEDLYPAIDKVLRSIQVQQLNLSNGSLDIAEYNKGLQSKLSAGVQEAHITNFVLDSAASSNEEKILYSDKIDISLQDYSLRLSDELHLLEADELNFSTESREISARGFRVTQDSSSSKLSESRMLYQAEVPLIHLQGIDMLKAYNQNMLNIASLQLQAPSFTINKKSNSRPASAPQEGSGFHEEDLYALIEDYLYTLNIDTISLQKGNIHVANGETSSQDAFVTQIRKAGLWHFRLDSTSAYQMNKLFFADNFELEIENYEHELPDNIHRITASEIGISTLNDRIYINDVSISSGTNHYPYENLYDTEAKTLIDLQIPRIELQGVDILKAYLQKRLEVDRVLIPAPVLKMGSIVGTDSIRTDLIKSTALYDLMKDYVELIQVKQLRLEEGEVDLIFYSKNGPLTVSGRNSALQVENFRFDSLTSSRPNRLFFADNVLVNIERYETQLPDLMHQIRAENVMASTDLQEVHASNVALITNKEGYTDEELLVRYQQKGYMKVLVPEIKISGLDFDRAYYDEELYIDTVYADRPEVQYTFVPQSSIENEKKQKKISLKQTGFYESIAPYLQVFSLSQLMVENGKFKTIQQIANQQEDHLLLDGISLQMDDFFVDSTAIYDTKRFLYANDISLQINQYRQELQDRLHILSAQNLDLSTNLQHVKASNIELRPKENELNKPPQAENTNLNRYHIELPALQINGIAFDEVYEHDRLQIRELLLEDPRIRISHHLQQETSEDQKKEQEIRRNTLRELIRGNLAAITVDTARIHKGAGEYIRYDQKGRSSFKTRHFTASVQRFHLESGVEATNGPFHADDIQLVIRDYERKLGDSLHMLQVDELEISTKNRQLSLKGVELQPRLVQDIKERLKAARKDRLFHIRAPLVQLQGVQLEQLQQDSLVLQNLLLQDPSIELIRFSDLDTEKSSSGRSTAGWQQRLPENLQFIQSANITMENGSLALTSISPEDTSTFRIGNIRGLAQNFVLDSLIRKEDERLFFADRLQLQIRDYTTTMDHELYELKIMDMRFDSWERSLVADSIMLTPLVDRAAFASTKGYETDQFTLRNRQLRLENIDYQTLISKGHFRADSLLLDGFNLHVYRDKRQPYPENHFPKMPQKILRDMELPVFLKGMAIRNGYIGYSERARGTRSEGFIDLTDLTLVSDTITNDAQLLQNGLSTDIALSCYLMGTGYLKASFHIPLGDTLNRHTIKGTLDAMALPDLNPILEKTVFVKIRSGYANQINFYVEADRHNAEGVMEFYYQDLKVALVNKKTGRTGGPVKEFGSLLANMFVINTHNTEEEDNPLRKGDMGYVRDDRRSIVNYWVKTLVNGFKSSIGI